MELGKAGCDPVALTNSFAAAQGTKEQRLQQATSSAIRANLNGEVKKYAKDGQIYTAKERDFSIYDLLWFIYLDFFPMLDETVGKFSGKDGHVWKWWLHGEGLYFGIHFWLLRFHVAFQEFQDYYQDSYMKEWANGVPEKKMAEDWKAYTVPQI